MSRRRDAADEAEAQAQEPTERNTAPSGNLRLLTAEEGAGLTCAVCHTPIETGHGYLQAAYGPVHYTDCAHKTAKR